MDLLAEDQGDGDELLTIPAFAKQMGVTPQAVRQAIKDGRLTHSVVVDPVRPRLKRIRGHLAVLEWRANTSATNGGARQAGEFARGKESYHLAQAREKTLSADLKEVELRRLEGELVQRRDVEDEAIQLGTMLSKALERLPDRCAAALEEAIPDADPAAVRVALQVEVRSVLQDIAGQMERSRRRR